MTGRLTAYKGAVPQLDPTVFIAAGAQLIGRVTIGPNSGIWFNAVLRADDSDIRVGAATNIQDGAVVHCDPDQPAIIGDSVTVGHNAIIHGCTIGDNCLIGMGAIILNGAVIGDDCIVGAGSLVVASRSIPAGSLVVGSPGRVIRRLTDQERETIRQTAWHYQAKANELRAQMNREGA